MPRGRKAGTANLATRKREAFYAKHGIMPIDYMLGVLRDERQPQKARMWAAQTAAPYCHPKLAQIETRIWTQMNEDMGRIEIDPALMSYEEREQVRAMMQRQATLALAAMDDDTIEGDFTERAA